MVGSLLSLNYDVKCRYKLSTQWCSNPFAWHQDYSTECLFQIAESCSLSDIETIKTIVSILGPLGVETVKLSINQLYLNFKTMGRSDKFERMSVYY